ncbi:MAG: SynChlorMet cassette protein ScmD [Chlorobiaceae bacterium]|nr:SynChlorMet cassette protein ScmD [Chlorobiaceae bacterium]
MPSSQALIANPLIVLREEFDDWAILFDPDTSHSYGLNPVSVFIYKRLDGKHSFEEIVSELRSECQNAPDDAETDVQQFLDDLLAKGLAGHAAQQR